jgi:hypothetical protein
MKSRLMILLAVMAIVSGGCAHMPSWMLRAHVDGYNRLHPAQPVGLEE